MDRLGLAKQSAIKSIKRREKMNAKKKHSTKIIGIILLFLGICVISFTAYHFFKNDAKSKTPNSKTSEEIPQTEKPSGNNPDELLNYSFQIYQLPRCLRNATSRINTAF